MKKSLIVIVAILLNFIIQKSFSGGPLEPSGAPAPTMKSLSEIEPGTPIKTSDLPLTIDKPGNYYLVENISFASVDKNGILLTSGDVCIDLKGFILKGPGKDAGEGVVGTGIITNSILLNVTIKNGTIRDWRCSGINLDKADFCTINSVKSINNGQGGMYIGYHSIVSDCIANQNNSEGIYINSGIITNCVCANNSGSGLRAIMGTLTNCYSYGNSGHGIFCSGGTVSNCVSTNNTGDGIYASGSIVKNCTGSSNSGNGINITGSSFAIENLAIMNGQSSGIYAAGYSRMESNHSRLNDYGIKSSSNAKNFVLKNSATGNITSDYSNPGTQTIGPMITTTGTIIENNPWANFDN